MNKNSKRGVGWAGKDVSKKAQRDNFVVFADNVKRKNEQSQRMRNVYPKRDLENGCVAGHVHVPRII